MSLDATVIELCVEAFPWAVFQRTKGAVKLHFTLDHDGCLPHVHGADRRATATKRRSQQQRFPPGTILVFDKAYIALTWFTALTAAGVYL